MPAACPPLSLSLSTAGSGVELRDTGRYGFILPADQIVPSGEETWAAVTTLATYIINNSK